MKSIILIIVLMAPLAKCAPKIFSRAPGAIARQNRTLQYSVPIVIAKAYSARTRKNDLNLNDFVRFTFLQLSEASELLKQNGSLESINHKIDVGLYYKTLINCLNDPEFKRKPENYEYLLELENTWQSSEGYLYFKRLNIAVDFLCQDPVYQCASESNNDWTLMSRASHFREILKIRYGTNTTATDYLFYKLMKVCSLNIKRALSMTKEDIDKLKKNKIFLRYTYEKFYPLNRQLIDSFCVQLERKKILSRLKYINESVVSLGDEFLELGLD
jgi:hypothetical protein